MNRSAAIVRLGGIRHKVLAIAGVVNRVRPGVIQSGDQTVPTVYAKAGLQGVVIGVRGTFLIIDIEGGRRRREYSWNTTIVNTVASEIGGGDLSLSRLVDIAETKQLVSV